MVRNAALLVSFLATASAVGEPSGIKFPFHLPNESPAKAAQDDAILETKKRFDRHCFNFILAVFDKHDNMDEVGMTDRVLPLCKAAGDHDKCKKWSADLFVTHENKKRKHDKKGGALLSGPKSNGEWCAELYSAAAPAPVESAPATPEVPAKISPESRLRGRARAQSRAEHVEHAHSEVARAEPTHVKKTQVEHDEHKAKVEHAKPKAATRKEVPVTKLAVKPEANKVSVAASEHKHEQAVKKAVETPTKPKEVAHELAKVVYAKTSTVKPAAVVQPAASVVKKSPVASTTLAPVAAKTVEIKPVSKKPVEAKAATAVKIEEKAVAPPVAAITKSDVPKQVQEKKSTAADECVCVRRGDGEHCSCPPGKSPPIPVDSQGTVIAAKAITELPSNSESGLNSLWSVFNGAESAAKGLFSSLQMR